MYINPVIAGVLLTVLVLETALVAMAIYQGTRH